MHYTSVYFSSMIVRSSLILAVLVCFVISSAAVEKTDVKDLTKSALMERCQDMQRERQKMAEDMRSLDADLKDRVIKMNAAADDQKLALATDLITQLVEQRAAMGSRNEKMQSMMMPHLMEHMLMGTASMAGCPMMKDVNDMKDMKDMGMMKNDKMMMKR